MDLLPEIIHLVEHECFESAHIDGLKELGIPFEETLYECAPKYLGIHPQKLCASYYIGASWLDEKHAVVVTPKISNLDFIEMFSCALKLDAASEYFSKFYAIDLDAKPIKTSVFNNQIAPLIIFHYVALLKRLTKRGLKKGYVIRNENLQSKIKGKIDISKHIKQNIICKREDRICCKYQEYTPDNIENRILKKALFFAESYISRLRHHNSFKSLIFAINEIKAHFREVSDSVEIQDLKAVTGNKLYKEYAEGIRLAKMILRNYSYSISETQKDFDYSPVFWIDMARLYEVYVYSKLFERFGSRIKFQVPGCFRTAVDFVDTETKTIIDTKYKPRYKDGNQGVIHDIRQLSAYSRDRRILKAMGASQDLIPSCVIIYPDDSIYEDEFCQEDKLGQESSDRTSLLFPDAMPISGYTNFYKTNFRVPTL